MATAGASRGTGPERAFSAVLALGPVVLDPEESSHLVRVRRVAAGAEVVLFDGRGTTLLGRLVVADSRRAVVEALGPAADREPARPFGLAVSLPEAGRADRIVEALGELGASTLLPLLCERTPPRRADLVAQRRERWVRLGREAAKVTGRSRLLEILPPCALSAVLAAQGAAAVLLDPDPALPSLLSLLPAEGPLPLVVVGPEGGFTPSEVAAARAAGTRAARLGRPALRVETAAAAAAALLSAVS